MLDFLCRAIRITWEDLRLKYDDWRLKRFSRLCGRRPRNVKQWTSKRVGF